MTNFRMYDIIKKKRDGGVLSPDEISAFVKGYTDGEIPDYQAAALCMAIFYRGMDLDETTALTLAIRDSGETLDLPGDGVRVDKHSTGGVGDKTSLVIAPIVASLGVKVAKVSGRGLGHTGGTVDKLESIRGFRTDLSAEEFRKIANDIGLAIVGQSQNFAPADKKLYALRDVTATVDSIPLIASSIMGKKLAANDDCILLDVKTGSGSFMKTVEESRALASVMVGIGKKAGKKIRALITDMDRPLGYAIGNALEVVESVETLMGRGPKDLTELCEILSAHMLELAGFGNLDDCRIKAHDAVSSGRALEKLCQMVEAQGGDPEWIRDPSRFPRAPYTRFVTSDRDGWIESVNTEGYGEASLILGAGRNKITDPIDYSAGIILKAKTGDRVRIGDPIAVLHTSEENRFDRAEAVFRASTTIGDHRPDDETLVLDIVS